MSIIRISAQLLEISVHYQAQVNYSTEKVIGVEALARWDSKELGNVPPSVFIPAVNSQNLVNEFSNYMIYKVLSDYSKLTEKYNRDITVSINITPSYFMDKNFLVDLQNALENTPCLRASSPSK